MILSLVSLYFYKKDNIFFNKNQKNIQEKRDDTSKVLFEEQEILLKNIQFRENKIYVIKKTINKPENMYLFELYFQAKDGQKEIFYTFKTEETDSLFQDLKVYNDKYIIVLIKNFNSEGYSNDFLIFGEDKKRKEGLENIIYKDFSKNSQIIDKVDTIIKKMEKLDK